MEYLKLQEENITHKFKNFPKSYQELEKLVQKTFKKDLNDSKLYFQNTAILCEDDYQFLLSQSQCLGQTLKLIVKPSIKNTQNYYLLFQENQQGATLSNETPQFCPPSNLPTSYTPYKYKKPSKAPRQRHNVQISQRNNRIELINHGTSLHETSCITNLKTNEKISIGRMQKGERREVELGQGVWRLAYNDDKEVKRIFGRKIFVDGKNNTSEILEKSLEVQKILGGDAINYVRFIKQKNLVKSSIYEILNQIVEEFEF